MNLEEHPTLRDAAAAMRSVIIYSEDPLASTIASRLITLEARYLSEGSMRRAYGWEWESLLGLLRVAETVNADEEAILSDRLTLRHRRLVKIGLDWIDVLGRRQIVNDLFSDLTRISRPGVAERVLFALKAAAVAGMLHRDTAADTPITVADENELSQPIRAVLIGRGVNL